MSLDVMVLARLFRCAAIVTRKTLVACTYALTLLVCAPEVSFASGLVILYPEVRQPYARVYADIIAGINETYPNTATAIVVSTEEPSANVQKSVLSLQPDVLITLGERNTRMAEKIAPKIPILVGAVTKLDINRPGISMIPDGRLVLDKLLLLVPGSHTVHVVTNAANKSLQMALAKEYAASKDISLVVHSASTVQAAAIEYKNLLDHIGNGEAIWLMQDKALNDPTLLSLILETAWRKRIAVFSSNPTHVKRGALFAIYPNNKMLGRSLGELAVQHEMNREIPQNIMPLRDLNTVVNGRTSRHLGVTISRDMLSQFDNIL